MVSPTWVMLPSLSSPVTTSIIFSALPFPFVASTFISYVVLSVKPVILAVMSVVSPFTS